MKTYQLTILLFILIPNFIFSQDVNVKWGEKTLFKRANKRKQIGHTEDAHILLLANSIGFNFIVHDKTTQSVISDQQLNFKYNIQYTILGDLININNQFFWYVIAYNNKLKGFELLISEFKDNKFGELQSVYFYESERMLVNEYMNPDEKINIDQLTISPNEKFVLFAFPFFEKKASFLSKTKAQLQLAMLDSSFNLLWDKAETMAEDDSLLDYNNFFISNDGKVIIKTELYNKQRTAYTSYCFTFEKELSSKVELQLSEDKKITRNHITSFDGDQIHIVGFYSNGDDSYNGIFIGDLSEEGIENAEFHKFNQDVIKDFNTNTTADNSSDDGINIRLNILGVKKINANKIALIAEGGYKIMKVPSTEEQNSNFKSSTKYAEDLLIVIFDKDQSSISQTSINKISGSTAHAFASTFFDIDKEKIVFAFNTMEMGSKSTFSTYKFSTNYYSEYVVLNSGGEITDRKTFFRRKGARKNFYVPFCSLFKDQLVVKLHNNRKYEYGLIDLK